MCTEHIAHPNQVLWSEMQGGKTFKNAQLILEWVQLRDTNLQGLLRYSREQARGL